jgi:RHS repeat-associated protein
VIYDGNWKYDNNSTYYVFTPRSTDILVAEVDFSADTVTDLVGQDSTSNGIAYGYASGDLTFEADKWNGSANDGEFYITGTSITTSDGRMVITKYYRCVGLSSGSPGGQIIAMRKGGTLTYLHSDHLGSTSLATDAGGVEVPGSRRGFYPYGELRYGSFASPTDRAFTGQLAEPSLGLYDYRARFYDPTLARFISADTIVPEPANPQSLNRFSYALGNPLKYRDPGGHTPIDICSYTRGNAPGCGSGPVYAASTLVHFNGKWGLAYRITVVEGTEDAAARMYGAIRTDYERAVAMARLHSGNPSDHSTASHLWGLSQDELFLAAYGGPVAFARSYQRPSDAKGREYWAEVRTPPGTGVPIVKVHDIVFDPGTTFTFHNPMHELGHAFAHRTGDANGFPRVPYDDLANAGFGVYNPPGRWNQNSAATDSENFADMFLSWCGRNTAELGLARNNWMTANAPRWMALAVAGN